MITSHKIEAVEQLLADATAHQTVLHGIRSDLWDTSDENPAAYRQANHELNVARMTVQAITGYLSQLRTFPDRKWQVIEVTDRYNPDKVLVVKRYDCGHYWWHQVIAGKPFNKPSKVGKGTLRAILNGEVDVVSIFETGGFVKQDKGCA